MANKSEKTCGVEFALAELAGALGLRVVACAGVTEANLREALLFVLALDVDMRDFDLETGTALSEDILIDVERLSQPGGTDRPGTRLKNKQDAH
jgi:hypothetical protein